MPVTLQGHHSWNKATRIDRTPCTHSPANIVFCRSKITRQHRTLDYNPRALTQQSFTCFSTRVDFRPIPFSPQVSDQEGFACHTHSQLDTGLRITEFVTCSPDADHHRTDVGSPPNGPRSREIGFCATRATRADLWASVRQRETGRGANMADILESCRVNFGACLIIIGRNTFTIYGAIIDNKTCKTHFFLCRKKGIRAIDANTHADKQNKVVDPEGKEEDQKT